MATNIPPHNLGEVVDVLRVMIHNPEATVSAKSYSLFLSNGNPLKTETARCTTTPTKQFQSLELFFSSTSY